MTGALKILTAPGVWTTIGGGSFATDEEVIAGVVDDKAVTPAGLAAYGAARDVMWVGTDEPTDPNIEMWWDPDEPTLDVPYIDVRTFGAVGDGTTDDTAAVQAAIDSVANGRSLIRFPYGRFRFTANLDIKRTVLEGIGPPPQNGVGGTVLVFEGTTKLYSSIEDTNNFKVRNLGIEGSATASPWTNGQTLVDLTGCNYPELHNVRIRKAQTGLKIANGATIECHYGKYWLEGIQECNVGVEFGTIAHTHDFYGGRFWSCVKGVTIPAGLQNVNFFGTAFECGAAAVAAVESAGTQIVFHGVRWETTTTNLSVLAGAGEHWDFAPFHSSGFNYADANSPSMIYGYGRSSGLNERALLSAAPGNNLLRNGSFEYDTDANGIADGWTVTASSTVVHTTSLDAADFTHGLKSQLISNTSSNNLRLEQIFNVTPNVPYVLRGKIKTTRASTFLRVGNGVTSANTYINQTLNTGGTWTEYVIGFTPTTAALNVTVYLSSTGAGDVRVDEMSLTQGMLAPAGFVAAPLSEEGGSVYGSIGFYGTTPQTKKTVTGAKGSNAALASLLTQLAALGLITDSSTA